MTPRHRVLVVGGGFGGLQAALHLAPRPVDVTLVDRRNFHLFQPLAYQVATGALSPGEICYPLRAIFRRHQNVTVLMAEVTAFDLDAHEVEIHPMAGDRSPEHLSYDTLIVAGGSEYSYFGHEQWRQVAAELKSLEGALEIRGRILGALEAAEMEADPTERQALLTFVVVGAGPTGVEMAGQIAEIARDTRRDFRRANVGDVRVLLVEAGDRLLREFPRQLSASAQRTLEGLGVTPMLSSPVNAIDETSVGVRSAASQAEVRVDTRTVIWAAGVTASPLARQLAEAIGGEVDDAGRVLVDEELTIPGHPEVLAIGDMVRVRGAAPFPGVAPLAMQQGRFAARLVGDRLKGQRSRPFRYRDKGNLATIGRAKAVCDLHVIRLSGLPAWVTWVVVHLWYLIGFQNRLLVLIRWAFSFFTHNRGARLITLTGSQERSESQTSIPYRRPAIR